MAYELRCELTGYYLASEYGPQMAELLAAEPEAITLLLSLPPKQQAREMAKLEGFIHGELMRQQQQYPEPRAPEPRKFSQAPPPISPLVEALIHLKICINWRANPTRATT